MHNALIIFVRTPELGKVKTRLAAQIGAEKALAVYVKLLEHTKNISSQLTCDKYVFGTGPADDYWKAYFAETQKGQDLGERMRNAFQTLFQKGYQQVVIIGSDCPELTANHILESFGYLKTSDVVIGPAKDGGYYLLGLKQLHKELFQNKTWSTSTVFGETMQSVESLRLSCKQLETLTDVDEATDVPPGWLAA